MANLLLAFPNLADDAVLSNGTYVSRLPRSNVQDDRIHKVARSLTAALTDTVMDADLGTSRIIRVVSILAHNASLTATVRIRGGDDPTFTLFNFDTGFFRVYELVYPSTILSWGDAGLWDGRLGQAEIDAGVPSPIHVIINPINQGRYWRIEFNDVTNPNGYVEFGKLIISPGYTPSINMKRGLQMGYVTTSSRTETDGGAIFHNPRIRRREFQFTVPNIPENEAWVKLFDIPRDRGTSEPLLAVYDPEDTFLLDRRTVWGSLRRLSPLQVPFASHAEASFSLVEEL